MLKRRLIAMLLCIAMIGSMTVYAVGDDTTCTCGTENDVHAEDCALLAEPETESEPVCTCNTENDEHTSECALYVAPVTEPEVTEPVIDPDCTCGTTIAGVHAETCPCFEYSVVKCICGAGIGTHDTDCPLYKAPAKETKAAGPNVGDKIWIKSGSLVVKDYKNPNKDPHKLLLNYQVEIKAIIEDENGTPEWYEFNFTSYGWGEALLYGYKYVKVENTSVEEPEDTEPETGVACSCGETAPENLADHADSCPRKTYVKTLFESKTAEEIYAAWDSYDETLQNDLLNTLKSYDNAKYEELNKLVNKDSDDSGFNQKYEQFAGVTTTGVGTSILAPEGAFPEGTTLAVTDTTVDLLQLTGYVSGTALGSVAVDISFNGKQPTAPVVVNMIVPESKIPAGANQVQVFHMTAAGPELCGTHYLNTSPGESIIFTADGFSTYVAVFVAGKYNAQLMRDKLAGNSRYSIVTFPVDIFDYDPQTINNALNAIPSDGNGFHFTGYGVTGCGSNSGINNSEAGFAKQGILANELVNGLPDINYIGNTSAGTDGGIESGKVLFSATDYTSAKTIYNDIPFEFIFDNSTGFYVYKSSANHAQLNKTTNRVELYADTLSTENAYIATLTPTTAGMSDYKDAVISGNSFKGTAYDGNTNKRMDPYVDFLAPTNDSNVSTVNTSDVGFIYVKAKIPASIGTNHLRVYIDTDTVGYNDTNSIIVPYTATGDWIEFVVDTSEINGWAGTLDKLRIDLFDWNSEAAVTGTYPVEIAQVSLIRKNYDAYATRGGYYPFSDIRNSYPGNNTAFSLNSWESLLQDTDNVTARATRSINNPTPAAAADMYPQLAYGTVMEFDFYIPVDKTGEDLTYFFDGDDDLWVFVDNKLALDIGGGHGAITGSLNFTNGSISVDSAQKVTGYNSGISGTTGTTSTGTMDASQYSPGKHTMKIFYLERGGSVSNCFMKFNLPQTPKGSVTVSKDVVEKNDASLDVLKNESFEFTIEMRNNGAGDDFKVKAPVANRAFYIVNEDGSTETSSTDSNGKFYLKDGQKAIFEIAENYEVTVTETQKDISGYDRISTTYNGTDANTGNQITEKNQEKSFVFVNTYDEKEVDLTYIPVNPAGCKDSMKGTVELTGEASTATSAATGVKETIGVRLGNPVGATAADNEYVKFVGWYSDEACTTLISEDKDYLPAKAAGSDLWTEETYYAKFEFKYVDLTIKKTGYNAYSSVDENQAFLFRVQGDPYDPNLSDINMTVTVHGQGQAQIKQLPVGVYTVTEMTDWSWRYDVAENGIDLKNATATRWTSESVTFALTNTTAATVAEFNNSRTTRTWLSGDSWCKNWWNGRGITEKNSSGGNTGAGEGA